jgi:DNA-binding GntR family transcriptional regulator
VAFLTNRLKRKLGGDLYRLLADIMTLFYERLVGVGPMRVELVDEQEPNMDRLARQDRVLNLQLAKMSKNPIFEWVMEALQQGFSSHDYALYAKPAYRQKTAANWYETAQYIAANDVLKALASIGAHYVLLRACIAEEEQVSEEPEAEQKSCG